MLTAAPPAPGAKDPGPALCFAWEALASRGGDAHAWEDFFPLNDADALETVTLRLVREWHMDGKDDLSLFEEISLGRASRWLLWQLSVQPGVKCFAALTEAARQTGAKGFVLDASVPAPYRGAAHAAAAALELPLEKSGAGGPVEASDAWKAPRLEYGAAQRAAMKALDIISRRRRGDVLCAYYHNLDPVLPELVRLGLRPVFADCPPKFRLPALARLGAGAWPQLHEPPAWSAADRTALDALRNRRSPALDSLCRWKGLSFRPFVEPLLDAVTAGDFPACAWAGRRLRERFRTNRPTALLLPYDGPPLQQLLQQAARLERVPSAMMLHGLPLGYRFRLEHTDSDVFLVWGPEQKALYEAAGLPAGQRALAVGNPYFDRYAATRPAAAGRELLLLTHPFNRWSPRARSSDPEHMARVMVDSALACGDWNVTLKLHPCESLTRYKRLLGDRPIRLTRTEPIENLLRRSAAVAGGFSTVLVEALLMGRPTLCVNLTAEIDPPPFTPEWGLPAVKSGEEFTRRLRQLSHPSADVRRIIARFLGPTDGGAARRVAEVVASLS